jgi:hypothetical protein
MQDVQALALVATCMLSRGHLSSCKPAADALAMNSTHISSSHYLLQAAWPCSIRRCSKGQRAPAAVGLKAQCLWMSHPAAVVGKSSTAAQAYNLLQLQHICLGQASAYI